MLKKALLIITFIITFFIHPLSSFAVTWPALNSLTLNSGSIIWGSDPSTSNYGYVIVGNDITSITATPDTTNTTLIHINGSTVANGSPSNEISLNQGANIICVDLYTNNGPQVTYKINVFRHYDTYTPGVLEIIDIPEKMAIIINDTLSRGRSPAPLTNTDLDSIQTLKIEADDFNKYGNLPSLDGLQRLNNLNSLTIGNCSQITNVDALQSLTKLSSLTINQCNISEDIYNQILDNISDKPVTTLNINYLSSFKRTFTAQQINKISAMTGLKQLSLIWDGISDIGFLANMTGLENLDISRNGIAKISGLEVLTNLKNGNLRDNYLDTSEQNTAAVISALQQHASLNLMSQNTITVIQDKTDKNMYTNAFESRGYTWSYDVVYGRTLQLLSCDPKQGYTFLGWDTDNDGIADHKAGDAITVAPAYSLTSEYTQNYRAIYSATDTNAYLSRLGTDTGTWNKSFDKYVTQYTVEVNNTVDSVSLDIEKDNENASYTIINDKGDTLPNPVPLHTGMNFVNIKVVSESGTNNQTYYMDINRPPLFEQGDGTAENPYGITTPEQLNEIRRGTDAHYILLNDIDMTAATSPGGAYYNFGAGWLPVQDFSGVLDGNSKKIIGLHTCRTEEDYNGMILFNTGTIGNLGMEGSDIYGGDIAVGGIVGQNRGTIEFCYNTGRVVGNTFAETGGIAGEVMGKGLIANCYNTGSVEGTYCNGSGIGYVGGIAGSTYYNGGGIIRNCFNAGRIRGIRYAYAAGILGWGGGVENCYNIGNIVSEDTTGGVVGKAEGIDFHGLYYLESEFVSKGAVTTDYENNTNKEYAEEKTDEEMRDESTYEGYDFDSVWTLSDNPDYPYPELKNMPHVLIPDDTSRFAGGNGLYYDPYQISTPEQLNNVRTEKNAYFILTGDIDMTQSTHQGGDFYNDGKGFEPIGSYDTYKVEDSFNGYFYGQGYCITGLYVNRPDEDYGGLFGSVWKSVIDGVNMEDVDISAKGCGGICGKMNYSDITYCSVSGRIGNASLNSSAVGGIVGGVEVGGVSNIWCCCNLADIDVGKSTWTGGILGYGSEAKIAYCYNAGDITVHTSSTAMGGIAGENQNLINDCFNLGQVKCLAQTKVYSGGIAGYCGRGKIERCFNTGQVDAGIIGGGGYSYSDSAVIKDCYYLDCNSSKADSHGVSKTLSEMKTQSTYGNYDFDNVWSMTQSFPVLKQLPYNALTSAVFAVHSIDLAANTTQMDVVFSPADATNKNCIWKSSNENVAKVKDGIVTLVSSGNATISFTTIDGGYTDSCTVTVGTLYYTVSFNTGDGGSIVPDETVSCDNVVVKPNDPVKKDYIFLGWYSDLKCTTLWDFTKTVKANVTLYAGWTPVQPYKYIVRDGKATITGYEGLGGDLVVPDSIDGYQVNAIDRKAFYERYNITTITLPAGITSIGNSAFEDCVSLTSITIPNGVISIPDCCFYYCTNLKNVTLPNSLQSIGMFAFYQTEISNITLPAGLNQIGTDAFNETPLHSITIPDGVTTIKSGTFQGCYALTSVNLPDSVTEIDFSAFSGCPYLYNVTIPKNVTNIGDCAFSGCTYMKSATFEGDVPASFGIQVFNDTHSTFKINYYYGKTGWTTPTWKGYSTVPIYTVTFDSQGGSDISSITAAYGDKIVQPNNPTLSGHVFVGWYTDSNYNDQWDFEKSIVHGNLKLYAKWIEGTHADVTTQKGSNVNINDDNSGVSLTFSTVTSGGETTIEAMKSKPSDADFYLSESCGYYNIETTAAFSGAVTITLLYDPSEIVGSESDLRLYQFKDGVPVDITVSVDTDNNTITGLVTDHFCAFAVGTPAIYSITASANNTSFGTVTGDGTYNHGDPVMLHAIPDIGYHFVRWTEGGSQVSASADYSFTVTEGRTLTAIFAINSYMIAGSANNPAYGMVSGGGTYRHGESVTLSATPNIGYRFVSWAENSTKVSIDPNYTITVMSDRSLTAQFTALTPVGISCSKTDVTLYGGSDGSVTITASGGDSRIYEYSINGGASWQNSNIFAELHEGTYTAVVRDAIFKNFKTDSVIIGQPSYMGRYAANKIPVKVNVGTAISIMPPAAPRGYAVKSVTYTSSSTPIAAVDEIGNVTFLTGGKATITTKVISRMTDSKGKVKTKTTLVKKTVTVNQLVSSITLNLSDTALTRTKQVKLTANIAPSTASNKKVTWKSSNSKVATVSSSGVVTGKAAGTVIITCSAQDGSGVSASFTVTVTPIYPAGIKLSKTVLTIKTGKTTSLLATITPKYTDFKTLTWTSSNPSIATVDAKGKIKAITAGTVTITVTTSSGLSASCTVTVQ